MLRFPCLLLVLLLVGCALAERGGEGTDTEQREGERELKQAELLLPSVSYDTRSAEEVPVLLAHAELVLRSGDPRAWAATQLAWGRYWLQIPEPSLPERVGRAQSYFDTAEFSLKLPEDAARLAPMYVWMGMAQMQLSQAGGDPEPHLRRALDHFTMARALWRLLDAEAESQAMSHLMQRLFDEWSRNFP